MLGLVGLAVNGAAAYRLLGTGLFAIALISTVGSFWSWGVMMNYQSNPTAAPNWSATMNMVTFLAGLGLLIASFVL